MPKLKDQVVFRGDKLFHGAVNLDWFLADPPKSRLAAESFLFHGPKYHATDDTQITDTAAYKKTDTASLARFILKRSLGMEDQPFSLTIAGYGSGKSHFALTIAELLSRPQSETSEKILTSIESADSDIGSEIHNYISLDDRPCLVVALNGAKNFDLTAEFVRQILPQLKEKQLDTGPLDNLRPRFQQMAKLVEMDKGASDLLKSCGMQKTEDLLEALDSQNEEVYAKAHTYFSERGLKISAFGSESLAEILEVVSREYCGEGKPFKHLMILFDEFGRYIEFATNQPYIAGSGVLQDLFEGVQANSEKVSFFGFIQYELNAYVQLVAPERQNYIPRYVTRYELAKRFYLSVNIETLIANLLEKDEKKYSQVLKETKNPAHRIALLNDLHNWFPETRKHRVWSEQEQFTSIVEQGCWPLSPFATWLLYYLGEVGRFLQERSILTLLEISFELLAEKDVPESSFWQIRPVELWSPKLEEDLLKSEEKGRQGSALHAYLAVTDRYRQHLEEMHIKILRSIVLSAKLNLKTSSESETIRALTVMTGLALPEVSKGIETLREELNAVDWDESTKQFEILGDTVPRPQFLNFLKRRVSELYDEKEKAKLFSAKASELCDVFGDIDCDFGEKNSVFSKEWKFNGVVADLSSIELQIGLASQNWANSRGIDDARGTVIFCYVEQSRNPEQAKEYIEQKLKEKALEFEVDTLPIYGVMIHDDDGQIGQALSEIAILDDPANEQELQPFGNLVPSQLEKARQLFQGKVEEKIRKRRYASLLPDNEISGRLSRACSVLFESIYPKVLPFPFDGFTTMRGNAVDTWQKFLIDLFSGNFDHEKIMTMPPKEKNRAVSVLTETWSIFNKAGKVSSFPEHPTVREIIDQWHQRLRDPEAGLNVGKAIEEICKPPYGANIPSASLLFAVFVAPRIEKIFISKDGSEYSFAKLLENDLFQKRSLNLDALKKIDLSEMDTSKESPWTELLDSWESERNYDKLLEYSKKAESLRQNIPLTAEIWRYRYESLKEKSNNALQALRYMQKQQKEAFDKAEAGIGREDVSLLSWGAASLKKLQEKMQQDPAKWSEWRIKELAPFIEQYMQRIEILFEEWIQGQKPRNRRPESIVEFKERMLNKVGGNLRILGLERLYNELEQHVEETMKYVELISEANELLDDVNAWLKTKNTGKRRGRRISEIRDLRDSCKSHSRNLQEVLEKLTNVRVKEKEEITKTLSELTAFLKELKNEEEQIKEKAMQLWDLEIREVGDLDTISQILQFVIQAYQGCEQDLQDFFIMNKAVLGFKNAYAALDDTKLSWKEFQKKKETIKRETETQFSEEEKEAIPWLIDDTLENIVGEIAAKRNKKSKEWLLSVEQKIERIDSMDVTTLNHVYEQATNPPAFITEDDDAKRINLVKSVEKCLETWHVEWLLEKFRAMPLTAKKRFLEFAHKVIENQN